MANFELIGPNFTKQKEFNGLIRVDLDDPFPKIAIFEDDNTEHLSHLAIISIDNLIELAQFIGALKSTYDTIQAHGAKKQ